MPANLAKVTTVSGRVTTHLLSNSEFQAFSLHTQPGEKGGSKEVSDCGKKKEQKQDFHSDSTMQPYAHGAHLSL